MSARRTIAEAISREMRLHAQPDSRFHFDFTQFIPGFEGGDIAAERLAAEPVYAAARHVFVTPDNGLVPLRRRLIEDGKTMVLPSYGLHRGFILLDPADVPAGDAPFAAWLDGVDHFGRLVSLAELRAHGVFDLVIAGASAITRRGLRFGMGHAYLDLEWGIFSEIGVVGAATPVAAIVHDIQLAEEDLPVGSSDVTADIIVTPTRTLMTGARVQPASLAWDLVDPSIMDAAPLRELREAQRG
ncbi:5-formyltetrahydrofolate cyclo-ligase [Kaistia dalseonensis]|uniref:5-formyltetrahydrofolate cyclo-ligase n=1 Tax=Kaistia dalseonensis TaxID=410840 RepID=A0ABU0H3X4_9HYPH|nr:5-formyltetrahydrofolate cyclo-ligase [Kaistia dalseonensis]MCX5494011.1 5-formyltetrahydrofolate cyclo-ligase [Kaistia dalseonensis]MDQ0436588.1 5-formyltetrahydrofolate cyclo-ligase [Kaistia dalseonensis]